MVSYEPLWTTMKEKNISTYASIENIKSHQKPFTI